MSKSSVLIVEDEIAILNTLEFFLTRENFEVFKANNGLEALSILEKYLPDIILLDGSMPIMNGKEFLERRVSDNLGTEIPVIFTSSQFWNLDLNSKIQYLAKPFDFHEMLQIINLAIKQNKKVSSIGELKT